MITWQDFNKIDLRAVRIAQSYPFSEAIRAHVDLELYFAVWNRYSNDTGYCRRMGLPDCTLPQKATL